MTEEISIATCLRDALDISPKQIGEQYVHSPLTHAARGDELALKPLSFHNLDAYDMQVLYYLLHVIKV